MPINLSIKSDSETKRKIGIAKGFNTERTAKKNNYSSSGSEYLPITRTSQFAGSGANVAISQPMFFSPMFTPQAWQIASRRKEIYQWARFFYENEPKVAAGVDFYSQFPMNGFTLECRDKKILSYFEEVAKDLKLLQWMKLISHEYYLLGDVFPFLTIDCPHCGGLGSKSNGKPCNHPDGKFKSITVLNPDYIDVEDSPFPSQRKIFLVPNEELKKTVLTREPKHVYDRLPEFFKRAVAAGQYIELSPRSVSHIKHSECPYGKFGTSLLRRLFHPLAYKTKLMTANWIVAERLVLPVRVIKLGTPERPAGPDDIADIQQQIVAVANDPNLTIVTHHAFEYEWYGACHSIDTEILTQDGFKKFFDLTKDDLVASYDENLETISFDNYLEYHEYDFKGKMIRFKHRSTDICVTPNHKMLIERNGQKITVEARHVQHNDKFISTAKWLGKVPEILPYKDSPLGFLELEDYLKFVGYYISEGGCKYENSRNLSDDCKLQACGITQKITSPYYSDIYNICHTVKSDVTISIDDRSNAPIHTFMFNSEIARYLAESFGSNSGNKFIPKWIKNLPIKYLSIIYNSMMNGDGNRREKRFRYNTVSKLLSDDFVEILLKLGYFSKTHKELAINDNCKDIYRINFSENRKLKKFTIRQRNIFHVDYDDKVYCVTSSTGYIVTRRNGTIAIHGNSGKIHNITAELELVGKEILDGLMLNQALLNGEMPGYTSAQVGVETLIKRLDTWRATLSDWIEEHIFRPTAMMQGFIDEEKTKELGKTYYLYPTIKWNDMQLRDKSSKLQMLMQLHDKGLISTEKLLEEFDIDYDQETIRLRKQNAMSSPGGVAGAGGAAPGGAGGGMPAMGGDMGMGGGMPGMDAGGGGMPGMDAGGGMGGPPMGGGGAGGAPPMGAAAGNSDKIYKRGKAPKKKEEEPQMVAPSFARLTRLEQKILGLIQDLQLPFKVYGQFKKQISGNSQPFVMDFAMPEILVDIEADGEIWHEQEGAKERDAQRDKKLADYGWRVIRFTEKAINQTPEEVKKSIYENVKQAANERFSGRKQAQIESNNIIKQAADSTEIEIGSEDENNSIGVNDDSEVQFENIEADSSRPQED